MTDPQGTLPTSPTATVAQAVKAVTPLQSSAGAAEFGDDPFDFELDDLIIPPSLAATAPATAIIPASPRNTPAAPAVMACPAKEVKEEDKPKRPLSAYNIFFKLQRKQLIEVLPVRAKGKPRRSHGKIGFAEMARTIAFKWKRITPQEKAVFQKLAAADKKRYTEEMKEWKLQHQDSENNEAMSKLLKRGADDDATVTKMKAAPKKDATTVPFLPSLTLDDAATSLAIRLSEAQRQFASAESALRSAQLMHAQRLQLMQSLGFEVLAQGPVAAAAEEAGVNHRGILDMALNLPLRMDSAENNAAYQSSFFKKQQQQLESMYGALLPSTAGLALPTVMPAQGSLGRKHPGASVADRIVQPPMASKNQHQRIGYSSLSPMTSTTVGGGGAAEGESIAFLANSMGPECCKFLIDIFQQD